MEIRENVGHYGLKLKMGYNEKRSETFEGSGIPGFEDRGFFLTGEAPALNLAVRNPGNERRRGAIILTWNSRNLSTRRVVGINVGPGESKVYDVPLEWLVSPGPCDYRVMHVGRPENIIDEIVFPDEFVEGIPILETGMSARIKGTLLKRLERSGFHTLCSYGVRDKASFKHEEGIRRQSMRNQKLMAV